MARVMMGFTEHIQRYETRAFTQRMRAELRKAEMHGYIMCKRMEQRELEERYNKYHDPKNGRFTSGNGTGSSAGVDKRDKEVYNDSGTEHIPITDESINAVPKPALFSDEEMNERIQSICKDLLAETKDDPPYTERAYSISLASLQSGKNDIKRAKGEDGVGTVAIATLDEPYISIHDHPSGGTFSARDVHRSCGHPKEAVMIIIGNNGRSYALEKASAYSERWIKLQTAIEKLTDDNVREIVFERAAEYGLRYYEI